MKTMKKWASLLFAFILVCGLTIGVHAEENNYTISVEDGDTHSYDVYQIFTGDYHDGTLSNIQWGQNAQSPYSGRVDETTVKTIKDLNDKSNQEIMNVIKDYVDLTSPSIGEISASKSLEVVSGYYLIKDKGEIGKGESYSFYITQVVGSNVKIKPKRGTTTFIKKVQDTNDSTNQTTEWQDSADYDIGDTIPFKLEATITEKYADYSAYKLVFHDKEASGLTFNNDSVKVYVDDVEITSGYTVKTSEINDGCTFEVVFENLKNITNVQANSKVRVEYTATLNDKAVVGSNGNENIAYVTYSNNPNGEGTGTTVEDKVKVFTYQLIVNKYANVVDDNSKLGGAMFILTKKLNDGSTKVIECAEKESTDTSIFTFSGLDDGEYTLTETRTPKGYNTMDPITFTISANHDENSEDPQLIELNGSKKNGEITFTIENGVLTTNVVNKSGSVLPSTGGNGTTAFYIIGGICILAASVLIVLKKKSA